MKPIATGKSCSGLPSSNPGEPSALPAPGSSSSPKYKGVRKRKWGRWVSEIRLPNSRERIWLGSYDSAEKAARAFDAALFCLRGRNAKFNFPSSPPDIAGAHSLSHQEIQAVAARYANESSGPELETGSEVPGSTTDHGRELGMDWSFLGALDESEGRASDFRFLYGELEYMAGDHQLHTVPAMDGNIRGGVNDGDDHDDGNGGNGGGGGGGGGCYTYQSSSFLWNF